MVLQCEDCWRTFPSGYRAREQHCDATGHSLPAHECGICDDLFSNDGDLLEHEAEDHLYCSPCDRDFSSLNGIRQHLRSSVHVGSTIRCPFCGISRATATGLVHHLERGACPKAPLDRDALYRAIRRRDPSGAISNKLLEFHGSLSYSATEHAFNYRLHAYQCYLCGKLYGQLNSLNQHLASPVHQQAYYHCPNRECPKQFTTLAATINHLESESCRFMRFSAVQNTVGRIFDTGRMISF